MRTFCTEGPVNPEKNYFVPRTALIAQGIKKMEQWQYVTIFAPHQSGKTTYSQFLIEAIRREKPDWLPVWQSFESYGDIGTSDFLSLLKDRINQEIQSSNDGLNGTQRVEPFQQVADIGDQIRRLCKAIKKDFVWIIDEVEAIKHKEVLSRFLHMVRSVFHKKEEYHMRSVFLIGVDIHKVILHDTTIPFNIADEIDIPFFSREEVFDLLSQHEEETGQYFEEQVKESLYEQTHGQPGLVNALAKDLVEKKCPNGERITAEDLYKSIDDCCRLDIDKNISNIIAKAKHHSDLIKWILFGLKIPFNAYNEQIQFLAANGVIERSHGICSIPAPIYKKALYHHFKPHTNVQRAYLKNSIETYEDYTDEKGLLDVNKLMKRYIDCVKDRGGIVFSHDKAGEGVYHYNIDAFFSAYAEFAGAKCIVEMPMEAGRVVLLLLQPGKTDIIEIKGYDADLFEKSQGQLKTYLDCSNLPEAHLVIFSEYHDQESYEKVEMENKTLHLWVVPVKKKLASSTMG